ncbi:MAG: N-acetylglucosamine-6-phosphate deacetylase [Alistipes sp.]|jgi:N-acetylglucosamine-6-phosphate deacetylase|nr:N-acetylglucosamine-6-phosphate deacetylase [Alistipes sp.]
MKRTKIFNGTVITPHRTIADGYVVIENGKIAEVGAGNVEVPDCEEIDAGGRYISPGFIDIHTHGAGGYDFMDGTVEAFLGTARMHARHGATTLYPTTLTSTTELLEETFDLYRQAAGLGGVDGAGFGGLHLEGPYFSRENKGAQDPRYLRNPEPKEYMRLLERGEGLIARWSLAPELDGAFAFGRELVRRGIIPAVAHTAARYEQVVEAYENGFRLMVHFFSCMSTITRQNGHRVAGALEAGYALEGMDVEIIGDGIHVYPPLLKLIHKIKGADHIALVSDSMRAAGMPEDRQYMLGSLKDGQLVRIEEGVAKLMDGSAFASSIVTMDRCVRTMYRLGEVPLADAVKMASLTPARAMGVASSKGSIAPGMDADIVLFDGEVRVGLTMVGGKVVFGGVVGWGG